MLARRGLQSRYTSEMPCLAVPQIHDFVTGRLDPATVANVDEHLDRCEICREIVASAGVALGDGHVDAASSAQLLMPPGTLLDRFEIEEVIGRGAMGVVYAARDPRLDRRVALKLLRADRQGRGQNSELMREAQSMAQLAHPNVVAVYDVGPVAEGEDELYVAMELVDGISLGQWCALRARSWPEVVAMLEGAGKGLAAAHSSGICHRDFKPDNVIVASDGRARVTDFGLAREHSHGTGGGASTPLQETISALSGTPAYMAPELFLGGQATEKSDQFSYCVTLFEALYGVRPFAGESLDALMATVSAGEIAWPAHARVPRVLERILRRGLRTDPAERYPSMAALLSALPVVSKSKRRMVGVAVSSALAAGVVASLVVRSFGSAAKDPCADVTQKLEQAWGPAQRSALELVLSKSGRDVGAKTIAGLDRFAQSWSSMRVESCQATMEREQSAELWDLRTQCLDRRLGEMMAVQEQVAVAGPLDLVDAPLWADALGDLHQCSDPVALRARVPLPEDPKARADIAAIESELDRVAVMVDTREIVKAKELAEGLVSRARALGYEPLVGESLQLLSAALLESGELDQADTTQSEALRLASGAQDHRRVADLSTSRILLVGIRQQKFEAALALTGAAQAAVAQAGNDPLQVANLHMNAGAVYDLAGKRLEAEQELLAALALYKSMPAGRSSEIASTLHNLAALAMDSGDRDLAAARFEESLALREDIFGAWHPSVAQSSVGLGALARRNNELAVARQHYERAEAIYIQVFGPDHVDLGAVHNNLAIVCVEEKDMSAAEIHHRRALAIRTAEYGEKHPLVAQSYSGLGNVLIAQGRYQEALALHQKSVAMRGVTYPADHPSIAIGLHGLAGALSSLGQYEEAVAQRREALRIFSKAGADAADVAEMQFNQAKDLWLLSGSAHRREALKLADGAKQGFQSAGESSSVELAEVSAWLAERS